MRMLISLGFLFLSILFAGSVEVPTVWAKDLQVTLANEVAGIESGMDLLPTDKGTLYDDGSLSQVENPGVYSDFRNDSKPGKTLFSARKKINSDKKYFNAGFITPDIAPVGSIVQLYDNKMGSTGPDLIYVDIGKRQGIEKGDRFTIYMLDRYIYHPVLKGEGLFDKTGEYTRTKGFPDKNFLANPGKPIGHRVLILGVVEIVEPGDDVSTAKVLKAYDSIEVGHKLMPYKKFEDLTAAFSQMDKFIEGYIVASKEDIIALKDDDVVYIDKGWDDDVRPGDHFEVYSLPEYVEDNWYKGLLPKKRPLVYSVLGEIKVIDTQKKTATAIIVKSQPNMEVGNQIRLKSSNHSG
ncbi:MAG: hypothetical protein F3739_05080 [Nitrospinae bacterium]|nr:hypothetical protein [Nitrospinota bacterium]